MPGMMDTILNIGLNDDITARLAADTGRPRFAYDLYRRLVQMFGGVVMGVPDEIFEAVITAQRRESRVETDSELDAEAWKSVAARFKEIIRTYTSEEFPNDPIDQLRLATEAVFRSWNGKRANDYREATNIPHDLGTAVNIQTMVFGNFGDDSATGVFMSRNATTGEPALEGDYLINAQGEASFSAAFRMDLEQRIVIDLKVEAALPLVCQASLEVYDEEVRRSSELAVIDEDGEQIELPENYEPVQTENGRLAFVSLVEDELLLALPQIPRKSGLKEVDYSTGGQTGKEETLSEGSRKNPFSALQDMLKQDKSN